MSLVSLHAVMLLAALLVPPAVSLRFCNICYGPSRALCMDLKGDSIDGLCDDRGMEPVDMTNLSERDKWKRIATQHLVKSTLEVTFAMEKAQKAKNPSGWTTSMEPPEFPDDTTLDIDVRQMKVELWLQKVGKAVEEGKDMTNFNEEFLKDFEGNLDKYKKEFEQKQKETWGPYREHAYQELLEEELRDGWCGTYEGKNGGFRRGCGVYIEGMEFKKGCHVIEEGQYAGARYCRCDAFNCNVDDFERGQGNTIKRTFRIYKHKEQSGSHTRGRGSVWLVVTSAVALLIARQERV